jgi:hypothetical protein
METLTDGDHIVVSLKEFLFTEQRCPPEGWLADPVAGIPREPQ